MMIYIFAVGGSKALNNKARDAWLIPSEVCLIPAKSTPWGFEKNRSQIIRIV